MSQRIINQPTYRIQDQQDEDRYIDHKLRDELAERLWWNQLNSSRNALWTLFLNQLIRGDFG
jgi:hypothetical protein